ncbi:MAG: DUF1874 domain-containing protein [Candidatus Aenigmarchaeota archaeon]|nr:DUF1874 domain-containing protein [Candidatus Aenigmarchaeota archaeon]
MFPVYLVKRFFVVNAFSVNMVEESALVRFKKIDLKQAKAIFDTAKHLFSNNKENFINAIGHEGTAKIASELFGENFNVNRVAIKLKTGDAGLIITPNFRLEEGKIYSYEELIKLLQEGKIAIYFFEVNA